MSVAQGETADAASEERPVEENKKDRDNNDKDHSDSEGMSYEESIAIASSMEDESDYKGETNQNDSDKENTRPTKRQKQVRITDKLAACMQGRLQRQITCIRNCFH